MIDRLAYDLQKAFPGLAGFSRGNVYRMRAFYLAYELSQSIVAQPVRQLEGGMVARTEGQPDSAIVAQPARQLRSPLSVPPPPVAELPWGHNVVLIERVKDPTERLWYAQQTIAHGWSRTMLEHITRFLLELGEGFAFVGRQVPLEVDGEDFHLDLLFYHLHLRCFVVIELKAGDFKPEYAGKMNFYLSAVDDQKRHAGDAPSIGLILCKMRSKVIAEYALRYLQRPVGVARYVTKLTEHLPRDLAGKLPTVKEIEAELTGVSRHKSRRGQTK